MSIRREKPIETMMIYKESVSPERAKELLLHKNPENRILSRSTVEKYIHDIRLGKWDDDSIDPVVFDKNEVLRNGEHRLTAIQQSGETINLWFAYDAEPSDTFDIGVNRTATSILKMRGYDVTTNIVAMIRAIGLHCFGVRKVSEGELGKAIATDGDGLSKIYKAASTGSKHAICKGSVICAALYCAYKCGVPLNKIESFARTVNTGLVEELGNNAPIVFRGQALNGLKSVNERRLIFQAAQEALRDYVNKIDRRKAYTGKTAHYASLFVDGFRNGTIYMSEKEVDV